MSQPPPGPNHEPPADSSATPPTEPGAAPPTEPGAGPTADAGAGPPPEPGAGPPAGPDTGPAAGPDAGAQAGTAVGAPAPGSPPPAGDYPPMPPPPEAAYGYGQPPPGGGDSYGQSLPEAALGHGQPGTAAAAPGMYVDPVSGLALPQGLELAPVGRRVGAFFLAIPLFIATLGIGYVVWGLVVWTGGQTPALQVLGMRCWRPETGRVPGFWWMALREIVGRWAEGILGIFTAGFSFILMLTRSDRRCLHDLIAGTVVLRDPDKILTPPA